MRIRSYGVFHRIYESMVLDMHPAVVYLRRSRIAPDSTTNVHRGQKTTCVFYCSLGGIAGQFVEHMRLVAVRDERKRSPHPV